MTDRFWPNTYGAGYFVTHVVARTVLGGAIGAAVAIAIISLGVPDGIVDISHNSGRAAVGILLPDHEARPGAERGETRVSLR